MRRAAKLQPGGRAPVKSYFCTWLFLYCLIVIVLSLLSSLPGDPRRRLQIGFWCNPWHVSGFKTVFGAILGTFRASKRFLVQSSARFGLQNGFWCNPWHVLGFKTVFGAILGAFWASKRFLVQSLARFGLQNGFWCNPRRVLRYPCRGATAYTPQTSRQGRVPDIFIRPYGGGRLMGANAIRPYTRVPGQIRRRPKTPPAKFAGARRPPAPYHPHAKGRPGVHAIDVDIRFHFRLIRYAVRRMTPRELIVSSSRFILPMPLSICSRRRQ